MALLQNNRSGVKRPGHAETRMIMICMCFGVGVDFGVVGGDVGAVMLPLALVLVLVPVLVQRAFRR